MYLLFKRLLDILVSLFALLILLPLFIPIIFLLALTGENEVFYFQQRIGKNSKYFNIWKFATMLKNSPTLGTGMITLRNDPRVTKVGKFLRKTKINELPQIINILLGDMSLVGPRPTVKKHADAYGDKIRDEIYSIKPGLTGIGSIVFRDEEQLISNSEMEPFEFYKKIIIPYKVNLEKWYLTKRSFLLDIKLILLTAISVISPSKFKIENWFDDLPKRNF